MKLPKSKSASVPRHLIDVATVRPPSSISWAIAVFGVIAASLVLIESILAASNATKLAEFQEARLHRELEQTLPAFHGEVATQFASLQVRIDQLVKRWEANTGVPLTPGEVPATLPDPVRALMADPRAKSAADCWDTAWRNLPIAADVAKRKAQLDAINLQIQIQSVRSVDRDQLVTLKGELESWSRLVTDADECSRLIAELLRLRAVSSSSSSQNGDPK